MRVSKQDVIAGVPAIWLRDVLRRCAPRFEVRLLAYEAGLTTAKAAALAKQLEADGLIVRDGREFALAVAGGALCNATARAPTSRSTAMRQLRAMLERVEGVNASDDWVYWVDEVVLFGSMLDETKTHVNDVDVALKLTPRFNGEEWAYRWEAAINAARSEGRRFKSSMDELFWPELSLKRHIRGRSTTIAMTTVNDGVLTFAEQRVVYRRLPETN